jgi:hypothetical protein
MPNKEDVALMAHLMRRAGFGATRDELDRYVAMGYEATVDELIDPPDEVPSGKTAMLLRYLPGALLPCGNPTPGSVQLDVPHDYHPTTVGGEDCVVLAPRVRYW